MLTGRGAVLLAAGIWWAATAPAAEDVATAARAGHALLTRLCDDFGGRLTGSPANEAAMQRLAADLRALGLKPEFDRFRLNGWERGADTVEVLAPFVRSLRVAALGYTDSTPPFTAALADLGDFSPARRDRSALAGRIGLLDPSTLLQPREYSRIGAELGLRAILLVNREGGGQLLARTGGFTGETLPLPILSVTQEEGRWLQRLLARGVEVRLRVEARSRVREVETANLVVRLPGRSPERIVVGAHFDSWDLGQGALDNGLGVAQLYALARHLRGRELARTVELVWFNGEEQGLWGARQAAARLGDAPVAVMVNLDMVGVPVAVNALGDADLVPALQRWHSGRARPLPQGVQNINWFGSDHTPYQLVGVRAVTFNAPLPREAVRYYHDLADTIDKLPESVVVESTAVIAEVVLTLAADPDLPAGRRAPEATRRLFTDFGLERRMRAVGYWPFPES